MTAEEVYKALGSDYSEVLKRLGKEERVIKYLKRMPEEICVDDLKDKLDGKEYTEAFRQIHTIKGICLNMGIKKLGKYSEELCEALRDEIPEDEDELYAMLDDVEREVEATVAAIKKLA